MTGPEHWREAERHLREAFACTEDQNYLSDWNQRQAQVHATLALAAATAFGGITLTLALDSDLAAEWNRAIGVTS